MTNLKLVGPLVFVAFSTLALAAGAPAVAEAEQPDQVRQQERVCGDFPSPGSRIAKRVCGTKSEVAAYARQDFEARAMNPLTGGGGLCWRTDGKRWTEPCSGKTPTLPEQR